MPLLSSASGRWPCYSPWAVGQAGLQSPSTARGKGARTQDFGSMSLAPPLGHHFPCHPFLRARVHSTSPQPQGQEVGSEPRQLSTAASRTSLCHFLAKVPAISTCAILYAPYQCCSLTSQHHLSTAEAFWHPYSLCILGKSKVPASSFYNSTCLITFSSAHTFVSLLDIVTTYKCSHFPLRLHLPLLSFSSSSNKCSSIPRQLTLRCFPHPTVPFYFHSLPFSAQCLCLSDHLNALSSMLTWPKPNTGLPAHMFSTPSLKIPLK